MAHSSTFQISDEPALLGTERWTIADLAHFPDSELYRYEIIDGELFVSKNPHWHHQLTCHRIAYELDSWSRQHNAGVAFQNPGVMYADDEAVTPDVVWISQARVATLLRDENKHLHESPDLVVEVLSPERANERRDREAKLKLYARRAVQEYWIVDWRDATLMVYRRQQDTLQLMATLGRTDTMTSPLLPGFACALEGLFLVANMPLNDQAST